MLSDRHCSLLVRHQRQFHLSARWNCSDLPLSNKNEYKIDRKAHTFAPSRFDQGIFHHFNSLIHISDIKSALFDIGQKSVSKPLKKLRYEKSYSIIYWIEIMSPKSDNQRRDCTARTVGILFIQSLFRILEKCFCRTKYHFVLQNNFILTFLEVKVTFSKLSKTYINFHF